MRYNEKSYLLRMSDKEYKLIRDVAKKTRRTMKDAILYSIEQQSQNLHSSAKEEHE